MEPTTILEQAFQTQVNVFSNFRKVRGTRGRRRRFGNYHQDKNYHQEEDFR